MNQADSPGGALTFILFLLVCGALGVGLVALAQLAEVRRELRSLRRREEAGNAPVDRPSVAPQPPPLPVSLFRPEAHVIQPMASPVPARPAVSRPPVSPAADDALGERLRGLGLLPPRGLSGEYALGAWWAARLGAMVGSVAVIFLGIWLNLRNEMPAWARLGELLALSAALILGGARLGRTRSDLGRVLGAVGLAGVQFAAWAAHNLAGLRVIQDPLLGWTVSLLVTAGLVVVALRRESVALARVTAVLGALQLWVALGVLPGNQPSLVPLLLGVALLGALPLALRGWMSPAMLTLLGLFPSIHALLARAGHDRSWVLQVLVALAVALPFILAARWSRRSAGTEAAWAIAFELGAFLEPLVLLERMFSGDSADLGVVDGVAALLALGLGVLSRHRGERMASGCFLALAVALAALGVVQFTEDVWTGLVWLAAAAVCLLGAVRLGLAPLRWTSEALALVAAIAFCVDPPHGLPWLCAIPLAHGLLLVSRERTAGLVTWPVSFIGVPTLAAVLLVAGDGLDRPWLFLGWALPVALAALMGSRRLLFAALPFAVFVAYPSTLFRLAVAGRSHPSDALLVAECVGYLAVIAAVIRLRLLRLSGNTREAALAVALLALAPLLVVLPLDLVRWGGVPMARASAWALGAALLAGCLELGRRWEVGKTLDVLTLAFVLPWVGLLSAASRDANRSAWVASLLLLGLGLLLLGLHRSRSGIPWASVTVAIIAVLTGIPHLPGAWESLVMGFMAVMTFVAGHLAASRGERIVGLACLGLASLHVVFNDLTDTFGRIVACAALAGAFFGIAWLYARWSKARPE